MFYEEMPVWMMVYYGWVVEGVKPQEVYEVLQGALRLMPPEAPFRGPKELNTGEFRYANTWTGTIERYTGDEKIERRGEIIYEASYMGGLVDQ